MGSALSALITNLGIQPGTPFNVNQFTFVGAVSPPTLITGRLGVLLDATESIVAPGLGPALRTFAMGRVVGVGPGNAQSIFLGDNITGCPNGVANADARQIIIGTDIVQPAGFFNNQDAILIGSRFVFPGFGGNFGASVWIGHDVTCGGAFGVLNAVGIGNSIIVAGGASVTIGQGAHGDGEGVVVGDTALITGAAQAIAIGRGARCDGNNQAAIAIGRGADARAPFAIAIGFQATAQADSSICIGRGTFANSKVDCIILGREGVASLIGDFLVGNGVNHPVNRVLIGPYADTNGTYPGLTWQLTNSNGGVDQNAPNLRVVGGSNTGAGVGGELRFETSDIGASGAAQQVTRERVALLPSTGAVGPGGAILRFSNFADGAGGDVVTWTNVPTLNTPTWLPVLYDVGGGPQLGYIPIVPA